jgi:hypothetical protein
MFPHPIAPMRTLATTVRREGMPRVRLIFYGMGAGIAVALVAAMFWEVIPAQTRQVLNLIAWPESLIIQPLAARLGESAMLAILAVHVLYAMLLGGVAGLLLAWSRTGVAHKTKR